MVSVGEKAPDFTSQSHSTDEVSLSQFRSEKNIILSFHIYSFTGGWTHQVSSFRMINSEVEKKDTQVLGISCDSKAGQSAFATSLGSIPYPVLSDFYPHGEVCQMFGVFDETRGAPKRAIIIIDKKGIVRFSKIYEAATDLNPTDILEDIKKL